MLDPSIFTDETPLTAAERLELWRRKLWASKLENWWCSLHGLDGITTDDALGDIANLPPYLRRQAQ